MNLKRFTYFICIHICSLTHVFGQDESIRKLEKQFDFEYAITVIDSTINQAKNTHGEYSKAHNNLIYEKIVIYEAFNKNKEALALVKLLKTKELNPYMSSKLDIELSLIYEKIQYFDDCFLALDRAKDLIHEHKLDSLKPFYFLRRSSAYRVSGNQKEALNHIDSALHYGHAYNNEARLAHIYLVKGFLERNYLLKPYESVQSLKKSAYYSQQADDLKMYINSNTYVLNWYCNHEKIDEALAYARKCLYVLDDNPEFNRFHRFYNTISNVYTLAEKPDSALYIRKKGELAKIDLHRAQTKSELAEIVTNFQNSVRDNELKKQKEKLKIQSFELRKLYIISGVFIILSFLIFYFFLRTRKLLKRNIKHQDEIKRINKNLKQSLENELFLTKELHHRVKNNLQIIIGLLELQANEYISVKAISKQIFSIAAGHELLYQDSIDDSISLKQYLEQLVNYILEAGGAYKDTDVEILAKNISLDLEMIIPIGLMTNELISNSLKHAKKHGKTLHISLDIKHENSQMTMIYRDNGEEFEINETKFGSLVIKAMIQQLRGQMKLNSKEGAYYTFTFPYS